MTAKVPQDAHAAEPAGDHGVDKEPGHSVELRTILQTLAEGVALLKDRKYVWVNRAMTEITGFAVDELLGQTTAIMYASGDDYDRVGKEAYATICSGGTFEAEIQIRRKDLAQRWARVKGRAIDASDLAKGSIWVQEDITERKQAEQLLLCAKEETERINKELTAFSYSVAHDLRTPLRGINGFSAILATEYADRLDATALSYLQRIQAASIRMGAVMDDLLALAHAGRAELRRQQEVDLSAMAQAVAESLHGADPQRRAEFAIAPGMVVNADPGLMRIALDNLLGNAWKFSAKTRNAKIEFDRFTAGGRPVFFVRDNGAGFDPAFSNKLFEQFQRLHTDSEYEGTGVGLAIVARVISRHGGRIWAEGAVGRGATFYFSLG